MLSWTSRREREQKGKELSHHVSQHLRCCVTGDFYLEEEPPTQDNTDLERIKAKQHSGLRRHGFDSTLSPEQP